jgi:hypothetical protein
MLIIFISFIIIADTVLQSHATHTHTHTLHKKKGTWEYAICNLHTSPRIISYKPGAADSSVPVAAAAVATTPSTTITTTTTTIDSPVPPATGDKKNNNYNNYKAAASAAAVEVRPPLNGTPQVDSVVSKEFDLMEDQDRDRDRRSSSSRRQKSARLYSSRVSSRVQEWLLSVQPPPPPTA